VVRALEGLAELRACVDLQEEVWGRGFNERVGVALLKIGARLGGVTGGAFGSGGRLVAFVFGLTGIEGGRPVHWSHMLAVRPGLRDGGLGRRLKAWQREELLERGVTRARWTFDPLESRNGWLNLGRLGAVVREYVEDMYGESNSPRHRGVGTDRFVATWDMDSDRVRRRLAGTERPPDASDLTDVPSALGVEVVDGVPHPSPSGSPPAGGRFLVSVPLDIQGIVATDPGLGRRWREATRAVLAPALAEGGEVRELVRGTEESAAYLVVMP
jgi:predicted GNAT superfamily acetyltransferase